MRKTILTLAMMLIMAFSATAAPTISATPASKTGMELKGDSVTVTSGDKSITIPSVDLQKVNEKINQALDDTLTAGGTTVEIDGHKGELTSDDIRVISSQWAVTAQAISVASIVGLLALVALVLFFRFLNRRNKYRVIEKAIENNYPLNELSLNDTKHSAIYVQQPVVTSTPPAFNGAPAQQPGQVPVGTPLSGQTPNNPVVMTDMVNWRALMPAIKWIGWGTVLILFSVAIGDIENPFWPIGLALVVVGVCKGFILYKAQKALQEAWNRGQQMPPREPMREGIPVPPPMDEDYRDDDNNTYQPY